MTMEDLGSHADLSWMRELRMDPEAEANQPNNTSRQVKSGHFVPVRPKPLKRPRLVIHSPVMAKELGLSEEACQSKEFLYFFSGQVDAVAGFDSWATPYALAIMGKPMYDNCPFKNGNGYGDGRAISIGEVVAPNGKRWEMQLKGGGPTPFCRGADGRAVLRSSVREFLASEAMHHLGISTTRAISLIVSGEDKSKRPWYSGGDDAPDPMDDPRLAQVPPQMRQMFIQMLEQQRGEPDVMIEEPCAITCRVAPSFLRIGHLDLFARRARKPSATAQQEEEHAMIVRYAFDREYSDVMPDAPLAKRALAVFSAATESIAVMIAGWLRVGFCQGNFNCDNCLIAGRQMDYGPFGFMDKYDPLFAKWVGSGEHYAFKNQPGAALANLATFATALEPILDDEGKAALRQKVGDARGIVDEAVKSMWCQKLGFKNDSPEGRAVFKQLEELMEDSQIDYVILFRQLATLIDAHGDSPSKVDSIALLEPLGIAFYKEPASALKEKWTVWIRHWLSQLSVIDGLDGVKERMNQTNPKYILREYMLVEAYKKAMSGDYSMVHELYSLIRCPYDEQPELESKYYRRAPDAALSAQGTAVMT